MADMNQEILQVTGLKAGNYELLIDNAVVTTATAAELTTGLNLADITTAPQYQQALQVMQINSQRSSLVAAKLRSLVFVENGYLRGETYDPNDTAALTALLDKKVESQKGRPWYIYVKGQCAAYITNKKQQAESERQVAALTDEMWQSAIPKPHQYTIRPKQ